MPAFFLTYLTERLADVFLQLGFVLDPLHDELHQAAADARSDLVEDRHRAVALDRGAHRRLFPLGIIFCVGAGLHVPPCRRRVVQIPILESETESTTDRAALSEDRQPLRARLVQPVEALAMNVRIAGARGDRLEQNRPLRGSSPR